MKISHLSRRTGTSVDTIRYYERIGLLQAPERAANNYRVYTAAHEDQLIFIRRARGLDMSLDEIRALLDWQGQAGAECARVHALVDEHIGHINRRIHELRALEKQLQALRAQCRQAGAAADCGILAGLSDAVEPADRLPVAPDLAAHHIAGSHGRF